MGKPMKQTAVLRQMAVFGNYLRPLKYDKKPLAPNTERRYTIHAFTDAANPWCSEHTARQTDGLLARQGILYDKGSRKWLLPH